MPVKMLEGVQPVAILGIIRLGNQDWHVRLAEFSAPFADVSGLTEFSMHEIYLDKSLPQSELPRVLLHELTHVALWLSGVSNLVASQRLEEAIADSVGFVLSQCLNHDSSTESIRKLFEGLSAEKAGRRGPGRQ